MMIEPIAYAEKYQDGENKLDPERKIRPCFPQDFLLVGQFAAGTLFKVFGHPPH